jgi:micrococcal nuclease
VHAGLRRLRPVAAAAAVAATASCAGGSPPAAPTAPDQAIVEHVIDGDTIVVRLADAGEEHVRLIGIDTPEVEHEDLTAECYGPEAADALKALLPEGTTVRLERDVEPRDRFGRLLAYVFRADDELFVNVAMAETGYADELTIEPNVAYRSEVVAAVRLARDQSLGLWGSCPATE